MRNRAPLPLLLSLMLVACQSSTADRAKGSPPRDGGNTQLPAEPWTGTLAVSDSTANSGPLQLHSVARLVIDAGYHGAPGTHALRIDVVRPGGALYAQLKGNLDADGSGIGASSHSMEVLGTPIETFRMTGTWQFVLNVDGIALASASLSVVD